MTASDNVTFHQYAALDEYGSTQHKCVRCLQDLAAFFWSFFLLEILSNFCISKAIFSMAPYMEELRVGSSGDGGEGGGGTMTMSSPMEGGAGGGWRGRGPNGSEPETSC